mmetsp:Transcript_22034/g.50768  ORF Transcript_22034/g.50768 Transcript_22034/m.50768 type:complete len:294 (+) Transcript_22034:2472-3353(+)
MHVAHTRPEGLERGRVADSGRQRKERALHEAHETLKRCTLVSVQGVNLVENGVLELETTEHLGVIVLAHDLNTHQAANLGESGLERGGGADHHLRLTRGLLGAVAEQVGTKSDLSRHELLEHGGHLPHEGLGGHDEQNTAAAAGHGGDLDGHVGGNHGLTRRGRGTHDSTELLVDHFEHTALPVIELEGAVEARERRETVVHLDELKLNHVTLLAVLLFLTKRQRLLDVLAVLVTELALLAEHDLLHLFLLVLLLVLLVLLVFLGVLLSLDLLHGTAERFARLQSPENLEGGG